MQQEVVIDLEEENRFLIEDPDSLRLIMVDRITIVPIANQITYSGFGFDINLDSMNICRKHEVEVVMNTKIDNIFEPKSKY